MYYYFFILATAQSQGFNGTFPQCCRGRGTEFQPPELMVI